MFFSFLMKIPVHPEHFYLSELQVFKSRGTTDVLWIFSHFLKMIGIDYLVFLR